jgi:hypothetical protein
MATIEIELNDFSTREILEELSYRMSHKGDKELIMKYLQKTLKLTNFKDRNSMTDVMKDELAEKMVKYLSLEQMEDAMKRYAPNHI